MENIPPFSVFAGSNTKYLAEEICNCLGCKLGKMNLQKFADGDTTEQSILEEAT